MRRWGAVVLGAACVTAPATSVLAATPDVRVGSFYFEDASAGDGRVVVDQGDRIRFAFEGGAQHTATVDGQFDSGARSAGQTYTTSTLTRAGTYTLYCGIHGASRHSTSLVVRPTAAPSPSPAPAPPPSAAPSPSPSPKATPSKAAVTVSPRPVGSATPSAAAPAPTRTAAPSPSPSLQIIPAPSDIAATTAAALPSASPSASPSAGPGTSPAADDVGSADSSGTGALIPWWLVLLVLAGVVGAVLAARRRRTP